MWVCTGFVSVKKRHDILSKNVEQEGTGVKKALQLFHRVLGSQQLSNVALMNMNDA